MDNADAVAATARSLVSELIDAGKTLATAESCTGGWIAKALTDINGSSQCFGYGVVSYSNGAKESLLGVSSATLNKHGAVSEAVVREMAAGALALSGADCSVAVSGIAGPDGGSDAKPIGTVWFAWAVRRKGEHEIQASLKRLSGERAEVRRQSVIVALEGIRERLRPAAAIHA